jgi:hypothetical protein
MNHLKDPNLNNFQEQNLNISKIWIWINIQQLHQQLYKIYNG